MPRSKVKGYQFGALVRAWRIEKGESVHALGAALDISAATVSRLENGLTPPPDDKIVARYAHHFGKDVDYCILMAGRIPQDIMDLLPKCTREARAWFGTVRMLVPRRGKAGCWTDAEEE